MSNNLEEIQERKSEYPNRKKLTIISQNSNEIIADIERADNASIDGTPINKKLVNDIIKEVNDIKTYYGEKFGTTLYKGEESYSRYNLDLLAHKSEIDALRETTNEKASKFELNNLKTVVDEKANMIDVQKDLDSVLSKLNEKKYSLLFSGELHGGGNTVTLVDGNQYDFLLIWGYTDAGNTTFAGIMPVKNQGSIYSTVAFNYTNGGTGWCRYQFNPNTNVFSCNNIGFGDGKYKNNISGWGIARIWGCKL